MTTQKPDGDVDVLLPESQITLGGETVTVAEITFGQALPLEPVMQPMINDLQEMFVGEDSGDTVSYQTLAALFGTHANLLLRMIAVTTGKSRGWIEALSDEDGQMLTMTFWVVNKGFFTRRLVIETMTSRAINEGAAPDGAASLPH